MEAERAMTTLAPWLNGRTWSVLVGDVRAKLKELPAGVFRTCVTSPPYWGLRDYGVEGQIGLEETPGEWLEALVQVFRDVRRVLSDDGTLWLNCGDVYAGSGRGGYEGDKSGLAGSGETQDQARLARRKQAGYHEPAVDAGAIGRKWTPVPRGFKNKDLCGLPWRLAIALHADGWWLRNDIIWHKPSAMPESSRDRMTRDHEYIFLLSKSQRYFFDGESIEEAASPESVARYERGRSTEHKWVDGPGDHTIAAGFKHMRGKETRNKRTVWRVSAQPFPEAHFATFPEALVEPCILAGSAEGDAVLDCFNGAGTVGVVATRHKRLYIGTELNPEYAAMSERRIRRALNPQTARDDRPHPAPLFNVEPKP